jgi:hypothetical protein
LLKKLTLSVGLIAAGLFLAAAPASAAPLGVHAMPDASSAVENVQYGYGGGYGGGYGRRGYGGGYGHRGYGGPRFGPRFGGRHFGYGRGHRHGYGRGYGRRGFY